VVSFHLGQLSSFRSCWPALISSWFPLDWRLPWLSWFLFLLSFPLDRRQHWLGWFIFRPACVPSFVPFL
jgi:hypothetical protein